MKMGEKWVGNKQLSFAAMVLEKDKKHEGITIRNVDEHIVVL